MSMGKNANHEGRYHRPRALLLVATLSGVLLSCALTVPAGAVQDISGVDLLAGVACSSSTQCLGVGSNTQQTVGQSAALDGTTGAISSGQTAQSNLSTGPISSVACASATLCLGVGTDNFTNGQAVSLNPATGAITSGQSVHNITGTNDLDGVSCPTATQCLGVGGDNTNGGAAAPLDPATGQISSGQSAHDANGTGFLTGVACASATQCLAVGEDSGANPLVVPLDPATGQISSSQSATAISGLEALFGVACPTSTLCIAVGVHTIDSAGDTEGETISLNPATGAVISGPQVITGLDFPSAITCASATRCLAVGLNDAFTTGLAAPIDPTTGAISAGQSTQPVSGLSEALSAACPTSTLCMAVGQGINGGSATVMLDPSTAAPPLISGPYTPLAPVRICDSRTVSSFVPANQCNSGVGNPVGPIAAGGTKTISVANETDGVPANATSVVLNVTAVSPSAPGGFMTVFPAGATEPNASNLNYPTGETVPNLVQVGVGSGGGVSFASTGQTDLIVDVEGFTAPLPDPGASVYNALSAPVRLCDTRAPSTFTPANQCDGPGNAAGTLAVNVPKNINVTNGTTIPTGATAAVLNVTVVNTATAGFLTAYPQGTTVPNASNLNFAAGQTTTNRVIVPLSAGTGQISVVSTARTDVIVDISGYYDSLGGAEFTPEVAPVRVCDTRAVTSFSPLNQCSDQPVASGSGNALSLKVTTGGAVSDEVPADATAVVVNLTGIAPSASTFLTVYPGPTLPNSSDLNPAAGETRANLVVATINPSTGKISVFNNTGSLDVIVDVLGWYVTPT
jgi:hypothetical protein